MTATTTTKAQAGTSKSLTRTVKIVGLTGIMFDRYAGDNDTKLTPSQRLYLHPSDGETVTLPTNNIMSFLSAKNTDSAPKRLLDSRKYKKFTEACGSFVSIEAKDGSDLIPITRNGKKLKFTGFGSNERCSATGITVHHAVARLKDGIPNPKQRPLLHLDWEMEFSLTLLQNNQIQEQQVKNIFEEGGTAVGFGTWRGRFGKFEVVSWK